MIKTGLLLPTATQAIPSIEAPLPSCIAATGGGSDGKKALVLLPKSKWPHICPEKSGGLEGIATIAGNTTAVV